jgi:tousled-like kinase
MLNAEEVYFPDKPDVSDGGKEFLKQCLMYDQAFRPTIAQLCENPYVLHDGI